MDFIISAALFLMVLVVLLFAWNYVSSDTSSQMEIKRMETKVLDISDSIIMTPGLPADWSGSDVVIIGLAIEEGKLNGTKVAEFVAMDYDDARTRLGTGAYDFYFRLKDSDNRTITIQETDAEAGVYPSDAEMIAASERYVIVDGTPATMVLLLWL